MNISLRDEEKEIINWMTLWNGPTGKATDRDGDALISPTITQIKEFLISKGFKESVIVSVLGQCDIINEDEAQ